MTPRRGHEHCSRSRVFHAATWSRGSTERAQLTGRPVSSSRGGATRDYTAMRALRRMRLVVHRPTASLSCARRAGPAKVGARGWWCPGAARRPTPSRSAVAAGPKVVPRTCWSAAARARPHARRRRITALTTASEAVPVFDAATATVLRATPGRGEPWACRPRRRTAPREVRQPLAYQYPDGAAAPP